LRWSKDASPSKEQSDKGRSDKERTVRFKPREVSDPCAAQAQCDQQERAKTTSRSKNGG